MDKLQRAAGTVKTAADQVKEAAGAVREVAQGTAAVIASHRDLKPGLLPLFG